MVETLCGIHGGPPHAGITEEKKHSLKLRDGVYELEYEVPEILWKLIVRQTSELLSRGDRHI